MRHAGVQSEDHWRRMYRGEQHYPDHHSNKGYPGGDQLDSQIERESELPLPTLSGARLVYIIVCRLYPADCPYTAK